MKHTNVKESLSTQVAMHTGVESARCYQCGKCSAGCPMANDMEYTPSMTMRMLQIEEEETDRKLLESEGIWMCLTCEMCISRCPMSVDIPKVMDYLREAALEKKAQNRKADKNIINFHKSFMNMVKKTGRSYEVGLVVDYKLRTWNLLQDVDLAPEMLKRGKLPLLPENVKGKEHIKNIFKAIGK